MFLPTNHQITSPIFHPPQNQGMWVLCGSFPMFSNLYKSYLHNKRHLALANLQQNICKKRIEDWTSHDLVVFINSACLLIS